MKTESMQIVGKDIYPFSEKRTEYNYQVDLSIKPEMVEISIYDSKGNLLHGNLPAIGLRNAEQTAERLLNKIKFNQKFLHFDDKLMNVESAFRMERDFVYGISFDFIKRRSA
jgi:hypothetical protein